MRNEKLIQKNFNGFSVSVIKKGKQEILRYSNEYYTYVIQDDINCLNVIRKSDKKEVLSEQNFLLLNK